ncbi:hypothetical protein V6N12_024147 [Hibiscus sabdariffa]|uniref:Uncharacterized protein n=1 Tax=Hibiscus sabdariffa TaxID=183260 RepID=A0ABR2G0N5_9ROSI
MWVLLLWAFGACQSDSCSSHGVEGVEQGVYVELVEVTAGDSAPVNAAALGAPAMNASASDLGRAFNKALVTTTMSTGSGNRNILIWGDRADRVLSRLGFSNSFRVQVSDLSGGIWLLWNDGIDVDILSVSNQFVHGRTRFTGGDCNSILCSDERDGGPILGNAISHMFRDFIFDNGLVEAEFLGDEFTWKRGIVRKRLDRYIFNEGWANRFPTSLVSHLDRVGSDHCPLLLHYPR